MSDSDDEFTRFAIRIAQHLTELHRRLDHIPVYEALWKAWHRRDPLLFHDTDAAHLDALYSSGPVPERSVHLCIVVLEVFIPVTAFFLPSSLLSEDFIEWSTTLEKSHGKLF